MERQSLNMAFGEPALQYRYIENEDDEMWSQHGVIDESSIITYEDDAHPVWKTELTDLEFKKWRKVALIVSWGSVFFQLCLGGIAIAFGALQQSGGTLGYGLEVIADLASTIVIIWRYSGPDGASFNWTKEKRATTVLSIMLLIFAGFTFGKSINNLIIEIKPFNELILFIICDVSIILYPPLAVMKVIIARKLNSRAFLIDAFCSVIASVIASTLLASLLVYWYVNKVWYLDPAIGILVALIMAAYGFRELYLLYLMQPKSIEALETGSFCTK